MASGLATLTNWTALTFTLEYCKWMLRLMLILGECEERRDAEADADRKTEGSDADVDSDFERFQGK